MKDDNFPRALSTKDLVEEVYRKKRIHLALGYATPVELRPIEGSVN